MYTVKKAWRERWFESGRRGRERERERETSECFLGAKYHFEVRQ